MNQPSPCPQCHTDRVWARAALGAYGISHVAFCPGCARAATLCGRCGGELVLMRQSSWGAGHTRVETVLQCPACRQTTAAVSQARQAHPLLAPWSRAGNGAEPQPAGARGGEVAVEPTAFLGTKPAPALMQRVADDVETLSAARYVRRHQILALVGEAARRADALARLELELSRLPHPDTGR
jgi:hypothetical protein